jgi:ABC-type Fe3+-hydroxamate transport system substrate-binding protein
VTVASKFVAIALFVVLAFGASAATSAKQQPPRIVSLIPSLTEDLFAIGAGPQVVGVSQFTDYPAAAAKLPQVSSYSSVDAELVLRLHPDVVVGIASQRSLVSDLRRLGLRVELMSDDSFEDIFVDLTTLGRLSGHEREAAALSGRLRARTQSLVRGIDSHSRPRVFVVIGVGPIFTVGDSSYIAHLIALAGGRNAAVGLHDAYARYSAEALLAAQPDIIVTDHRAGLGNMLSRAPWNALRSVREHRVYVPPDDDILERPGPRYNDGLAWLISHLHPRASR